MTWPWVVAARRCPNDRVSRVLTSSSVTNANRPAASPTPQNISTMANARSHGACAAKEKSP
jgi:hypothetical protein